VQTSCLMNEAAQIADLFILRPTAMWLINLHAKLQGTDKPAI